jgi:hypothetical protein
MAPRPGVPVPADSTTTHDIQAAPAVLEHPEARTKEAKSLIRASVEHIADRFEAEFTGLRTARSSLSSRINRAEDILVTHLSLPEGGHRPATYPRRRTRGLPRQGLRWYGLPGRSPELAVLLPGRPPAGQGVQARDLPGRCGGLTGPPSATLLPLCAGAVDAMPSRRSRGITQTWSSPASPAPPHPPSTRRGSAPYVCRASSTDERAGWVACETCSGTGRAHAFVYPRRSQQRLQECAGCGGRFSEASRKLVEVTEDHESLIWFPGDRPCRRGCAGAHGVL